MSKVRSLSLVLLCFWLGAGLCLYAQSCAEVLRAASRGQASRTISVQELLIPARAREHLEKARLAGEAHQPEIFARETERALALAPRFGEVYLLRAIQQLRLGQNEAALENVAASRRSRPDLPWSHVVGAGALTQLRRYDEAVAELLQAQGAEAESWQASFERARAEVGRGDADAALRWSELAVAAAPVGCTDALLVRANAFRIAGRVSEAIHQMELYLKLDRRGENRAQVLAALAKDRAVGAARTTEVALR